MVVFVSANLFAEERFTDNGNGTITDQKLKLMWSKNDNQGDIGWKDGQRWVKYSFYYLLPGNKYDDWRLPTVKELKSLYTDDQNEEVVLTDCGMRVNIVRQIHLSCGWVWSAEEKDISANVFTFRLGYHFSDLKMHNKAHRVLAVRNISE